MIHKVSFTNFKSLRRIDAELGRFMVIVGPNGSGKTSILDGLHYLAQATTKPLAAIMDGVFAPPNLNTRGTAEPMRLALEGRFQGVDAGVTAVITCQDAPGGSPTWSATVTRRWGETKEQTSETRAGAPRSPMSGDMAALAAELGSARKLRLDVEMLAAPSYSREETPRLGIDGKGLASVLADVAGGSPELFQSITEAARRIIPALERIRTRRARVQEVEQQEIRIDDQPIPHAVNRDYWGQQLLLDFKGAPDVLAPLASEGTLLIIGLLTALWTAPRPRLLLLDDIDKALHPQAQRELVEQLRKVLEMDPELQIIATSHSPYLLDHFKADDVLVTALRPDGSTACAPLTAHPDFNRWKSTTQPGELWSFLGDDWVAQRASGEQDAG
jgi:predicted ATPase